MTYILTTNGTAGDREAFLKIVDRVHEHADGLIARFAGVNERGLAITAIWESKAQSDRFAAEHLFPAVREIVGACTVAPPVMVEFEAFATFQRDAGS